MWVWGSEVPPMSDKPSKKTTNRRSEQMTETASAGGTYLSDSN